jgi:hypothetical protein
VAFAVFRVIEVAHIARCHTAHAEKATPAKLGMGGELWDSMSLSPGQTTLPSQYLKNSPLIRARIAPLKEFFIPICQKRRVRLSRHAVGGHVVMQKMHDRIND